MSRDLEILRRRLEREKKARLNAEAILEKKALELYNANTALRKLNESLEKKVEERTQQLKESERKYRGIIENMELGLMEVDNDHKILKAYDWFCDMTGYDIGELEGKNAVEVFLPPSFRPKIDEEQTQREQGQAGVYEVQIMKKDGSLIWVLISGAPIFDKEGNVTGSLGIHYDITARKTLEHDLEQAKQIAEAAQEAEKDFLARMSHEIRTPLNAIIGMSHLLYDTHPTEDQKEYLSILKSSADILQALISDILDFSKIQAGEIHVNPKEFDLVGLIKSLQKTFQLKLEEKPIEINIDIDPGIENLLLGDDLLLNQILLNLLSNAAKFTAEGEIKISVDIDSEKDGMKCLNFQVSDTGIGIEKDKLNVIFDDFKQADNSVRQKFGGTGLGLAITKQLIELQGGSISVESELDQGTVFSFQLAYEDCGIKGGIEVEELSTISDGYTSEHKILVAEDNYMNRKYISSLLNKWKIEFDMAHDGKEAVLMTQENNYDLIFMDISMPKMNGYEATIAIRNTNNKNQTTPIVALTASALISKKAKALELGMTDYLPKPFKPINLFHLIQQYSAANNKQETIETGGSPSFEFNDQLDVERLNSFYDGDLEYAIDMFETFLTYSMEELKKLSPLIEAKDLEAAQKLAHKLKPSFAMVGLTDLESSMAQIEKELIDKKPLELIAQKLATLESNLNDKLDLIETQLAEMKKNT